MKNLTQLNDFNFLVNGRNGRFLANRYDTYLGYALIQYGECCEIEDRFLSSLVLPGDVVVEVGANIGVHTISLAKKVGPHGKVIAIEAQPAIAQYLCANISLNGLFNVVTHNCGCGARHETMSIPVVDYAAPQMQNFGDVSLEKHDVRWVSVNVMPLDELIVGLPKVDLLKLDVEGMEGEVLQGAMRTIKQHRPWIYLENDRVERSQALIEQVMALDYRLWWHIPSLFNPDNYFGVTKNEYGNVASFNMLCIPREVNKQVNGLLEITDSTHHPLKRMPASASSQPPASEKADPDTAHGELEAAVKLCRDILAMQPNNPEANHSMGEMAVHAEQPASALPYFVIALAADPANRKYWLDYIDALMQADQPEEAREQLRFARQHGLQGEEVDALTIRVFGQTIDAVSTALPPHLSCPVCNGTCSILDAVDFNKSCEEARGKFLSPAGIPITYVRCDNCAFCFAPEISNWPIEEFERRIYNDEYVLVDPDYIEDRPKTSAQSLIAMFGERTRAIKHLDYGGGSGLLSRLLGEAGWQSISYDPFVNRDTDIRQLGNFDLITVFEVFEHVPDVHTLMSNLRSLLSPNGIILFSTLLSDGNIHSKQKLSWWYASPRNGHISLFSRKSLSILAQQNEFSFGSFSAGFHYFCTDVPGWADHLIQKSTISTEHVQIQAGLPAAPAKKNHKNQNAPGKPGNIKAHKWAKPSAQVMNKLASLFNQGQFTAAESLAKTMTMCFPLHGFGWKMLGAVLNKLGQIEAALHCMKKATTLLPHDAEAHNNLGSTLMRDGQMAEAEASCRRALKSNPNYLQAHNLLGVLLMDTGRQDEAEASYHRALQIDPDYTEANNNYSVLLMHAGRLDEAEFRCRRTLQIDPDFILAYSNLGIILMEQGHLEEAEASCRCALERDEHPPEVDYNLGLILLAQGSYVRAWPLYESRYDPRLKKSISKMPNISCPQWQGESLLGKSLVIWTEQGFGDHIQFVRYAPLLKARGVSRLTLLCPAPLKALFETVPGVDDIITDVSGVGSYDYWSFPLSLPLYFDTTLDTIPGTEPYLYASPARLDKWRDRLPASTCKVGLVWKGSAEHKHDAHRSLSGLHILAPLWSVAEVSFVSLQKGRGEEEAKHPPIELPILALGSEVSDFADTAAIIEQLDLVICVDTSVAHLAGALGKPCWVLLPANTTDWRWLRERDDSPWYPSLRLFRQQTQGDWQTVIAKVTEALRAFKSDAMKTAADHNVKNTLPAEATQRPAAAKIEPHVAHGELEAAVKLCRSILEMQPNNPEANHSMGGMAARMGQHTSALPYFEAALAADPANRKYWLDYIDALIQSGQREEAQKQLAFARQHGLQGAEVDALACRLGVEQPNSKGTHLTPNKPLKHSTNKQKTPCQPEIDALLDRFNNGKFTEVVMLARQMTERYPRHGFGWKGLGLALQKLGRNEDALLAMQESITLLPDDAEAYNNLGNTLSYLGRLNESEAVFRRALQLKPDYVEAHINLGVTLYDLDRTNEAEMSYRRALQLNPNHAEAHYNLGNNLQRMRRLEEAVVSYRRALQLRPEHTEAHYNLGATLYDLSQLDEAEKSYHHALRLKPDYAEALNNLGITLMKMGRVDEAEAAYRHTLQRKPDYLEALNNLGLTLMDAGKLDEAESNFRHAQSLNQGFAEAHYNLGLLLLSQGRYAEGWPYCEQRYNPSIKKSTFKLPSLPCPQWQGESLLGKSLVIWTEQGFGDHIQFVRYAPLLKARGVSRLTLLCPAPLKALFETVPGVDDIITDVSGVGSYDYWSFPLSLPLYFDTTLDTIPGTEPYLYASPARLDKWRDRLPASTCKVGLVWKGSAEHKHDAHRSLSGLHILAPLWSVAEVSFVSLQKGRGEEEAKHPPIELPILALGSEVSDFADTAAIIEQLDLVICVDTSVAHLAGALGKPCWVLLPANTTDWRWLRERDDSPWYPSLRLFRQQTQGDWQTVIAKVTEALRAFNR